MGDLFAFVHTQVAPLNKTHMTSKNILADKWQPILIQFHLLYICMNVFVLL